MKCTFCEENVYADTHNVLLNERRQSVCPVPYWVVRLGRDAVETHFGKQAGATARAQAAKMNRTAAGHRAVQIRPHGHQQRR